MDERGDNLSAGYEMHSTQYNLEDIIERVGKLAVAWSTGVELLKKAFKDIDDARILDELGNAIICGAIWRSAENSYRIFKLRKEWCENQLDEFKRLLEDELALLLDVLPWIERDPRQGYHIEPGAYMFTPELIRNKIHKLRGLQNYRCGD